MVVLSEKNLPYIASETEWVLIDDTWHKEYTYSDGKIAKMSTNVDPSKPILYTNVFTKQ